MIEQVRQRVLRAIDSNQLSSAEFRNPSAFGAGHRDCRSPLISKGVIGTLSCWPAEMAVAVRLFSASCSRVNEDISPPIIIDRFLRGCPGAALNGLARCQHGRDHGYDLWSVGIESPEVGHGLAQCTSRQQSKREG
jgi:hypothetical protein